MTPTICKFMDERLRYLALAHDSELPEREAHLQKARECQIKIVAALKTRKLQNSESEVDKDAT